MPYVFARPDLVRCTERIYRYAHYYTAGCSPEQSPYAEAEAIDQQGNRGLMMDVDPGYAKVFLGGDVAPGNHLQLTFYLDAVEQVTTVQTWHVKADGVLTPQELAKHPEEAKAGILEELTLWGDRYKVMTPVLRERGMNVMTSKYVPKWKKVAKQDGTSSAGTTRALPD